MSASDPILPDEDDALAAEVALGLLDAAAMRAAERRMRADRGFAAAVDRWSERLSPMLVAVEPVLPPQSVWQGIDEDLGRMTRTARPVSARSATAAPAARRGGVPAFWRPFALASSGLLAASLAAIVVLSLPRPVALPMTASIMAEGNVPIYTAVVDPGTSGATLIPVADVSAPGHSHELWLIAGSAAPRSLGVLASAGPLRIEIPRELLEGGGVLAISLEPVGGSPTGQPTGPVVAKGELRKI